MRGLLLLIRGLFLADFRGFSFRFEWDRFLGLGKNLLCCIFYLYVILDIFFYKVYVYVDLERYRK